MSQDFMRANNAWENVIRWERTVLLTLYYKCSIIQQKPVERKRHMSLEEQKYVNLGELELEVLDVLWEKKIATVKDILDELARRREIAYTTVMTVMTRLSDKGVLKRHQSGRTYVYKPRYSRDQIAHSFMDRVKDKIFKGNLEGMLSYMVNCETLTLDDLDRLRSLISEKEQK